MTDEAERDELLSRLRSEDEKTRAIAAPEGATVIERLARRLERLNRVLREMLEDE